MYLLRVFLTSITLSAWLSEAATPSRRHYDTHIYYALEHKPGGSGASLDEVAEVLGVQVVEQAGELQDIWLVRTRRTLETRDEKLDPVISAFQVLQEQASSPIKIRSEDALFSRRIVDSINFLERQTPRHLVKRAPPPPLEPPSATSAHGVANRLGLKDPMFQDQWHLVNDDYPEHMMNATPVWDMGFTGKGILTSFLDDGLDFETEDLKDAFDAENSYDFNDHVPLPRPVTDEDSHGTRCAGQVAARRNEACGVGIAYDAKAAGVRILGGPISTVDEAVALNYGFKNVSVYSCSWGPRDDGATMDGPSYLIRKAVVNGINHGRGGKGSIFVFASGNGAAFGDQCNFDGYTNSIYSVTVSAIDHMGLHPIYSEACAANMIVAYSSGSGKHIVTTDRGKNACATWHGGTSAAAPNAVGVFTLALQARPELTWRDIQHLCVLTARTVNPDDPDWERTASGKRYSYKYGYGALDASAYVKAAQTWDLVKPQAWIHTKTIQINNGVFRDLGHKKYSYEGGVVIGVKGVEAKMKITEEMMTENNLEALEHLDVRVWISHTRRGDVGVEIFSPNGIKSVLAKPRSEDASTSGFPGWRFMTIKHWGENPVGEWTLRISDQNKSDHNGTFLGWNMALWGSAIDPAKAHKILEPVVDNALPETDRPTRPVIHDSDVTSIAEPSKPISHIATSTSTAIDILSSGTSGKPIQQDDASEAWYGHMTGLLATKQWYFIAFGAAFTFAVGAIVFFWRRRVTRQRLANYTSLATDDINMGAIGQNTVIGGTTRALYDAFAEPSSDDLPGHNPVDPPRTGGLGFNSGFLEDDDRSAGLPQYRDEPDGGGVFSSSDHQELAQNESQDSIPRSRQSHELHT